MGGQVELVEAPNGAIAEFIEDNAAYPRAPDIVLKLFDRYDLEQAVVVPPSTLIQGHM